MSSSDDVEQLRRSIISAAPSPPQDPWEWELLTERAATAAWTRELPAATTDLFVRVSGKATEGHRLAASAAAEILSALQGAVTAIAGSIVREIPSTKPQMGVRKATEFFVTPRVSPGSLVFHLDREEPDNLMESDEESLADRSLGALLSVLDMAQEDSPTALGHVTERMQPMGVRAASNLAKLVDELNKRDAELHLTHVALTGARERASLDRRGREVIQEAVERNQERSESVRLEGLLNTSSDGSDKVRITLPDDSSVQLEVDPALGARLGQWIGRRVTVQASKTVRWSLASAKETTTYAIVDATLTPPDPRQPALIDSGEQPANEGPRQ